MDMEKTMSIFYYGLIEGSDHMFVEYNPNPTGRRVEDCSIRAVAKALDIDWETAFLLLANNAFQMGDLPHSNSVIGSVLRQHNFYRQSLPDRCPDCYTVQDFAREHPMGTYVLFCNNHVVCVKDGRIFDTWDSSELIPSFYWYRKDE